MTFPLVLDTDIGTDVDDALALAFAMRHPDLDLRAVTTVSEDATLRARIAARLLELGDRADIPVAAGRHGDELVGDRRNWFGHEGEGIDLSHEESGEVRGAGGAAGESAGSGEVGWTSRDDGVDLLIAATATPCAVATVGMQSNVAAALDRDAGFARRVPRLAVMGGVFAPVRFAGVVLPPSIDHNLNCDQPAALRALDAGLPTLYVPGDVTMETFLPAGHLDRLRRGDDLCRALARLIDVWTPVLRRLTGGLLPDNAVAILHDPLTVACLVEPSLVSIETRPVTVAMHGGVVRTFVDPVAGTEAEVVTSVDAAALADCWLGTVLG